MVNEHIKENIDATMITAVVENPTGYGRIIRDNSGNLIKIVEEKDCNELEKNIKEINPGIYIFKISELFKNLERVKSKNESKEYYLTDVIELINNNGIVKTKKIDNPKEIMGINTVKQLESFEE
jgi:bifunctional N-acetylglucosamine-1-phosphate-uridyltransferase/glucosamine-1-phosphate-acetyltransferase GlmU-like protein